MGEVIGNIAYVVFVGSSWLKQELWLRVGLSVASLGFVLFGVLIDSPTTVVWNLLFGLITAYRVFRMITADRNIVMTTDEIEIHESVFPTLTRGEFLRLWDVGIEHEFRTAPLVAEGEDVTRLLLVLDGDAIVEREGRRLADLGRGAFAGEMAFATGAPASATVRALDAPVRCRVWSTEMLRGLLRASPEISNKLERVISADLVAKLQPDAVGASAS